MTTTTPTDFANIPHPAGATHVAEWNLADPTAGRYFSGTKRVIDRTDDEYNDDIEVEVWGTQTPGEVSRHVNVTEGGYERVTLSSAAHARQFGEALIAAADEWDQMAESDSLAGLQARVVELVGELFRRGVGAEELCRLVGASSLDELRSVVGNDEAWR
jgi:hypothetical protein